MKNLTFTLIGFYFLLFSANATANVEVIFSEYSNCELISSSTIPAAENIADADCPSVVDYDALMALYNATNGDNWTNNTNWDQNCDIGTWHGITTNNAGRVIRISLRNNGLSGTIPNSLSDINTLTHLQLDRNALSGTIPGEIGTLSNLRYLYLYNNDLSGGIPTVSSLIVIYRAMTCQERFL